MNPIFQRADWMVEAACRGMDPDWFHPRRGQACDHIKAVCKDCPVIDPCRKMALEDHTLRGVWGGLSESQRRDYRQRRRNRTARVSAAFQSLRGDSMKCDLCGKPVLWGLAGLIWHYERRHPK